MSPRSATTTATAAARTSARACRRPGASASTNTTARARSASSVESGTLTLIGATTENPSFEVNGALLSRCRVFTLRALGEDDLRTLVLRALADTERGLGRSGVTLAPEALEALIAVADGDARRAVGYDDLLRAMDAQQAVVETGDILCLHTGQTEVLLAQDGHPDQASLDDAFCHLDGCDDRLLAWIADSGIAAIAADNFAVEAVPPTRRDEGLAFERLHELCLFKLGMPLGELWFLADLARWLHEHRRSRFLLTAPPIRLPGAF